MTKPDKVSPQIELINCGTPETIKAAAIVSKGTAMPFEEIVQRGDPAAVSNELKRRHNSLLEFVSIDVYARHIPNIDVMYLSSFENASIIKQSFRNADHNSFSLTPEVEQSSYAGDIIQTIAKMYSDARMLAKDGWRTELEQLLPLCSTTDITMKTNLRELFEMNAMRDKIPSSLAKVINDIFTQMPAWIGELSQSIHALSFPGYLKDRMFTDKRIFNAKQGLIYDNYESGLAEKNIFFVINTPISFKVLSQIIRERRLGIGLNFSSIRPADSRIGRNNIIVPGISKLTDAFNNISSRYGLQNAIGILPFSTEIMCELTLPLQKIRNGFFSKLTANEPLKSYGQCIYDAIVSRYPRLNEEIYKYQSI